jgi:hypothetical protein
MDRDALDHLLLADPGNVRRQCATAALQRNRPVDDAPGAWM